MKTDWIGHTHKVVSGMGACATSAVAVDIAKNAFPQKFLKQKGATLFTALIFLIMLSLLGINAAQMSGLEERMAGNSRSRDLAFQAASATLRYVETNLASFDTQITAPPDLYYSGAMTSTGLRPINVCLPNSVNYWNGIGDTYGTGPLCPTRSSTSTPDCSSATSCKFTWSSALFYWTGNGTPQCGANNNAVTALTPNPALTLNQVAAPPLYVVERLPNNSSTNPQYRVTVLGIGGDCNAIVILQALYSHT